MKSVETARAMLAAFDGRDVDAYVSYLATDVVVRPPGFILGEREHHGPEEVRAAFLELQATLGPDRRFAFRNRRYFVDGDDDARVLVIAEIMITRSNDRPFGTEAALLLTMVGDKVSRIDSWRSAAEGLSQLENPVAVRIFDA
jgi:ketosteroid isomerase-like protein